MHFKSINLFWYICVLYLYVSFNLCFDLYLIYVNHLGVNKLTNFHVKG
jgi:hypothetical protein